MGESLNRFRELDGLRGLAALAVALYHLTIAYPTEFVGAERSPFTMSWGMYGVQLFFLISGYVILMTAQRAIRPSDFVISRISRLYPVYWIAVTLTIVLIVVFAIPDMPQGTLDRLLNYTMVQRWLQVPNVDGVYWTLAVEMQFYVAVLLLLLVTRCRITGRTVVWVTAVWLSVALVVAIWAGPSSRGVDPQLVATPTKLILNFSMAEWAPLFSAGMFAYLARSGNRRRIFGPLAVLSGVLAGVIAGLLHSVTDMLIVSSVVAVFLVVVFRERTGFLLLPPVQWYGRISYSLYIGHNRTGLVLIMLLYPLVGTFPSLILAFAGVSLISWLLYRAGEVEGTRVLKRALLWVRDRWDCGRASTRQSELSR